MMRSNNYWRVAATAAALIVDGYAQPSLAQTAPAPAQIKFDIRAQPLGAALNELALQAQEKIVFAPEVVRNLRTGGVRGQLTVEQALEKLLGATRLTASRSADGFIMILRAESRAEAEAPPAPVAPAPIPIGDPAPPPPQQLAEVVVTGSRLITNGNDSPTPVTVVAVDDLQATRPTTVFEGLIDLPVFAGSRSAITNPGIAGATNNNISALSLRGLGQQRTLILYDGHRVPPTQQDGYVDVNMIPQMLLRRVEVVTGGVSAVYGSDAISGVVNFITHRKFDGLKLIVQRGISELHDDRSYELGLAFGTSLFDGRGHFEGSVQTHDDDGILHRTDRSLGLPRWTLQGTGTAAYPYFLAANATIGNVSFGGKIVGPANNPLVNQHFAENGVLTTFANGSTTGVVGNIQLGGDGGYYTSPSLKAQLNFHQLYGRFDLDITDELHYYVTAAGTAEHSFNNFNDNQLVGVTLSATNAFLPALYQQQMSAAGVTVFSFGKMWSERNVPPQTADHFVRQWFMNTGLEGSLDEYKWEGSYTRSRAKMDSRQNGNIDNGRLYAALDAVASGGRAACGVTVTHPGLYPGCVPLNVFGPTAESAQAIDYILSRAQFVTQTTMDDVSGSLTGAPLDNWIGPMNLALSAEWRRLGYKLDSNALPAVYDPLDCTGLRYNCVPNSTPRWTTAVATRPPVSMTVSEAAVEAEVPLLKDLPFAQAADLNTAYRYARYSISGNPIAVLPKTTSAFHANTWKLGLNWHFNQRVTLRATRSRDFRAPNLNDLYAPGSTSLQNNLPDNLTGVTQPTQVQIGGNPHLTPEVGYTSTVGVVFEPTEKFSLAVDGYDITVRNAIVTISGYSSMSQSNCYASGGASFFCSLQERPTGSYTDASPANAVTKWHQTSLNVAEQKTWGADIEANYRHEVFQRPFSLRALATYQPHAMLLQPGATPLDFAGVDFSNQNQGGAVWRATVFAHYSLLKNVTVNWMTRWRSRLRHNADRSAVVGRGDNNVIPSAAFSNVGVTYRIEPESKGQADLYLNVQNVFNRKPYPSASSGPQGEPGKFGGYVPGDDPVGRYYSLGMRYQF